MILSASPSPLLFSYLTSGSEPNIFIARPTFFCVPSFFFPSALSSTKCANCNCSSRTGIVVSPKPHMDSILGWIYPLFPFSPPFFKTQQQFAKRVFLQLAILSDMTRLPPLSFARAARSDARERLDADQATVFLLLFSPPPRRLGQP